MEPNLRNIEMIQLRRKYMIFGPELRQKPPKAPQKSPKDALWVSNLIVMCALCTLKGTLENQGPEGALEGPRCS